MRRLLRACLGLSVAVVAIVATLLVEGSPATIAQRNLALGAIFGAALIASAITPGPARDLPFPRRRIWSVIVPAAAALVGGAPSLRMPYLADDHFFLALWGDEATPFGALSPHDWPYFRPIDWLVWWVGGHVSRDDAWFLHGLSWLFFATASVLLVAALRRFGVRRGIAVAAGILFGLNPIGLDTLAWTCNLHAPLTACFFLGALATLPYRGARLRRMALPTALATAAFLTKELSFFLPAAAVVVGARGRWRNLARWLRLCVPIFAALGAVLVLRVLVLGAPWKADTPVFGGRLGEAMLVGAKLTFEFDDAGWYAFPARVELPGPDPVGYRRALEILPTLLLALGGASAAARVGLRRGLVLAVAGLLPCLALMPMHENLGGSRLIFLATTGVACVVASLAAGVPLGRRGRWLGVAVLAAVGLHLGRVNIGAWDESSAIMRRGSSALTCAVQALPAPPGSLLVLGLPDYAKGTHCFINSMPHLLKRSTRIATLDVYTAASGFTRFDRVLEYDAATGEARDVTRPEPERRLAAGERARFDFHDPAERAHVRLTNLQALDTGPSDPRWLLPAWNDNSSILLPPIGVPAGATLRIRVTGERLQPDGTTGPIPVAATFPTAGGAERQPIDGEVLTLPPDADVVTLELRPQPSLANVLAVEVEATAP